MNFNSDQCPWCGSTITPDKFKEIEAKIRAEEQENLKEVESSLRKQFEAEKQDTEKRFKAEANNKIEALSHDLNDSLEKIKSLEASKDEFINHAQKEADRKAVEKIEQEVKIQRLILERDLNQKILKQQEIFYQEREGYQKKISELNNQLQKNSAQELEGSTINLSDELQEAFPDDEVTTIHTGESNEKLIHKVFYKGIDCGFIIIDSKTRQSWQKNFVTKLRVEQVNLIAEHAILATTVFPKGKKELCIEDGVIVAHPSCVTHIVDLLRKAMIKMCIQGLSIVDRSSKTNRLYEFISSEAYTQKRQEAFSLTNAILELDVIETKQHQKTWKERGSLATRLKNSLFHIDAEINEILEENTRNKTKPQTVSAIQGQTLLRKVI